MPPPLIVTALRIEANALGRVARAHGADLRCIGPGPACAERLFDRHTPDAVLLAGLAGGLVNHPPTRTSRVIDARTRDASTPTLAHDPAGAVIVTTASPACTPADKRALADTHGAHLVDNESASIARACDERRIPWGVLRVVSDGPDESLPPQATRWIDNRGRTRTASVLLDTCRTPALVADLRRLSANTSRALRELRARVEQCLDDLA